MIIISHYFINLQMNGNRRIVNTNFINIKQTWLAERLGKSFCIVNSYVCNCRKPSLEVLFEMAKMLNVEPEELISNQTSH